MKTRESPSRATMSISALGVRQFRRTISKPRETSMRTAVFSPARPIRRDHFFALSVISIESPQHGVDEKRGEKELIRLLPGPYLGRCAIGRLRSETGEVEGTGWPGTISLCRFQADEERIAQRNQRTEHHAARASAPGRAKERFPGGRRIGEDIFLRDGQEPDHFPNERA